MAYIENGESTVKHQCSKTLPNIFLIGDSIRLGYCKYAKEALASKAEVFYPADNCRSSQFIIASMKAWAGELSDPSAIDLVQFNCGHWDAAHWDGAPFSLTSEAEYEKNLALILYGIRKHFPNARVVLATTTAINEEIPFGRNYRDNEMIDRYNAIALRFAEKNDIPVNDLNTFVRGWGIESYKDFCHFTPEACARLGKEVAARLQFYLSQKASQ